MRRRRQLRRAQRLAAERGQRLGCVDVEQNGVVGHRHFADQLGMLADQMARTDHDGQLGHFREEAAR